MSPNSLYCEKSNGFKMILRGNLRKNVSIYTSFENSSSWQSLVVCGIIVGVGRDHMLIENIKDKKYSLILFKNIDYIEINEPLDYFYPYNSEINI